MPGSPDQGYVLDIQADLLSELTTRVVIPLLPESNVRAARNLNPIFDISGGRYVLLTQAIATVPK